MSNQQQIRDFFRKIGDGLTANPHDQPLEMLHNSTSNILPRRVQERREQISLQLTSTVNDFGVGLPPQANC